MSDFTELVQGPQLDAIIELFTIDLTSINPLLPIYRITPTAFSSPPDTDSAIRWGGETFAPVPCELDELSWNGRGALPTPKFRIANTLDVVGAAALANEDFLGATLTREKTFRRFLDGEPDADPTAKFEDEVWTIERKSGWNKIFVEFVLSSSFDQEGVLLPRRQVMRDLCTHEYRVFNPYTGDFDSSNQTCPYTGSNYYDRTGAGTTEENDSCGRRVYDCRLRFGQTAALPIHLFPGVGRVR